MSLCLSMIVKNEAHVIQRCLRSVRPYIDSYSISDTGSTDDTMEIIREELAGLPGVLVSDAWQDYSTNRNLALDRCVGDHILSIDADDVIVASHPPLVLPLEFDGFAIRLHFPDYFYWQLKIIRNDPRWRWVGKLHEVMTFDGKPNVVRINDVSMNILGAEGSQNEIGKYERYLAILEHEPATARNLFYHGQTLAILGRYLEAADKYLECAAKSKWDEEVYVALWQVGYLLRLSGRPIEEVLSALLRAHNYRPQRLEALVELCEQLRLHGKYQESYDLSLITPALSGDTLFVHPHTVWRILEEHGLAALCLGKNDEAREYFLRVAEYDLPEAARARVEGSLGLCERSDEPASSRQN